MKLKIVVLLMVVSFFGMRSSNVRADDGWKFSNLNPFGKTDSSNSKTAPTGSAPATNRPPLSSKPSGLPSSKNSVLPSMNPFSTSSAKTTTPSTWNKMSAGSQNVMTKTKQTLMPWSATKPAPPQSVTGTNRVMANGGSKGQPEKKGMFASWMKPDEPPAQPKTVKEFLGQPRPQF